MLLHTRTWGEVGERCVVCVHGIAQHGGVFGSLAERLARRGHAVICVDLRGHGRSGREPPWTTASHVGDLLETLGPLELTGIDWVGHSFGGRVAAAAAAAAEDQAETVILLDPSLQMRPEQALQGAELGRLDWSFETPRGAINAVFAARGTGGSPPREVVSFVEESLRRDGDGRYRFDFSPGAVVAAWSEMSLPAPPVADVPTLVVTAGDTPFGPRQEERYRDRLGAGLSLVRVPNGHNVLWESPEETGLAIERFLEPGAAGGKAAIDPTPGYLDAGGSLRPLL